MGDNSDKKKNIGHLFFMRNPYMKFQNISIHGSKVMLCTKKHDERTNELRNKWTNEWTDKPEAICPQLFSKLGASIVISLVKTGGNT